MIWDGKSKFDFWEAYNRRNGGNKETVHDHYKHEIAIPIINFNSINEMRKAEEFCKDSFGALDENDKDCPWQVCSHLISMPVGPPGLQKAILVYLFHKIEDATLFKLAWGGSHNVSQDHYDFR